MYVITYMYTNCHNPYVRVWPCSQLKMNIVNYPMIFASFLCTGLESTLNTTSCCHNESNTSEDIDEGTTKFFFLISIIDYCKLFHTGGTKNLIIFGGVAALLVIIIIVIALVTVTIIIIFIKNFKS